MPDEDIMDQLKEIDEDEILGEEVSFDDDLDFEGLDDMDSPSAAAPTTPPAVAPPAPQTKSDGSGEAEKPAAKKSSAKPKSTSKPKVAKKTAQDAPAQAEESVTEVEEVVVRAKILRIVADKVIIEPGDNISLSSS